MSTNMRTKGFSCAAFYWSGKGRCVRVDKLFFSGACCDSAMLWRHTAGGTLLEAESMSAVVVCEASAIKIFRFSLLAF